MYNTWYKYIFICMWALFLPLSIFSEVPRCYSEIERSFFRSDWVSAALAMHDTISQSAWTPIVMELKLKAERVPGLVRARAAQMHPNPFEAPFDPEEAGNVLKYVLIDVLAMTLAEFNITDSGKVHEIFNYVQEQQMAKWQACFTRVKPEAASH